MRFAPLGQKMFTRRNWLLRCSILVLINIAVILYIGTHLMICGGKNFSGRSTFFIQESQARAGEQANVREPLSKNEQLSISVPTDKLQAPAVAEVPNLPLPNDSGGPAALGTGTNTDGDIVTGDEKDFQERLRSLVKCYDRTYTPEKLQRGHFSVLKNYVRAEYVKPECHESITYTTHADYIFLDNLIPLLERWNAPVSIVMHAPGTDYRPTVNAIRYLRDCLLEQCDRFDPSGSRVIHFLTNF